MERQRKKPTNGTTPTKVVRHGGSQKRLGDKESKTLQDAGHKLGNKTVADIIQTANGRRDDIMEFIVERLKNVRAMQIDENLARTNPETWYRDVFKGAAGHHLPEPGRWAECARHYRDAAKELAAGHMGRARALLERAMQAETQAYETLPVFVKDTLDPEIDTLESRPVGADNVGTEETCTPTDLPKEIALANKIMDKDPSPKQVVTPKRKPHTWWTEEEEEEEEADGA